MVTRFEPINLTKVQGLRVVPQPTGEAGPAIPAPGPPEAATPGPEPATPAPEAAPGPEAATHPSPDLDGESPPEPGADPVPVAGPEPGATADDQAAELADHLRALAASDPQLANALVRQLVATLNEATGGAFSGHLSPAARQALNLVEP